MTSNAIFAQARTVRQIFSQPERLTTPLMQRRYEWRREPNWRQLWEDLLDVAQSGDAEPTGFLGTIVLKMMLQPFGAAAAWPILDGQQRLVTLLLLIETLRRRALSFGMTDVARQLERISRRADDNGDPGPEFVVAPSRADGASFERAMTMDEETLSAELARAAEEAADRPGDSLDIDPMIEALGYFGDRIDEHLGDVGGGEKSRAALARLVTALLDGMHLVVVCVNAERLDPYAVFETLNARGRPLSNLDLTKNYLFSACVREGVPEEELEALERELWRVFHRDDLANYWSRELSRGSQRGPVIDWFLRAYLQSHPLPDEIARDATLNRAYSGLRKMYLSGQRAALDVLKDLCRGAQAWLWIEDKEPAPKFANELRQLKLFGRSAVDSFLLACALHRWDDDTGLAEAFHWVRSYLIRRYISRKLDTPVEPLVRIAHLVRSEETYATQIAQYLARREGALIWPDEQTFRDAWMNNPLYKPKDPTAIAIAKTILSQLEEALRDDRWEPLRSPEALTIEHILPLSWRRRRWPAPKGPPAERRFVEEKRDQVINTIGNLTLATYELNQELDNDPWSMKRGRLKESGSSLNRRLLDDPRWKHHWDVQQIEERAATLFVAARELYPHPAS